MSGVNLKIGINTNNFKTELQAVNARLKEINSSYKANATSASILGNQEAQLQNKQKMLTDSIIAQNDKMKILQEKYDSLKQKQADYTNKINDCKQKISEYTQKIAENTAIYGENSEEVKRLKEDLKQTQTQLNNTEIAFTRNATQMSNIQTNINNTSREINELNEQLNATTTNINNLNNTNLDRLAMNFRNIGDNLNNIGGKMKSTITQPIENFAKESTNTGVTFDYAMADLSATSGATGEDLKKLEAKAKELGATTCKSATESAQAMKYLALAGYSVDDILNSIEPVLKASVAWGSDLAQTSDIITDSMSAYGLSVSDLNEYIDTLSQAQRSSNTTAIQLGEGYITVAGQLKNMGIPLQESATWMGILANQGLKGSEAGNSLSSILVNLYGLTSTTADALEAMGVKVYDNQGNFRGLTTVLYDVYNATKDMNQEQRDTILGMLGGKTQLATLNMLLNGVGEQYDNLSAKINNFNGVGASMYDTMQNSTQGKIDGMKSALEAIQLSIFSIMQPTIEKLIVKATEFLSWLNSLDDSAKQRIVIITAFIAIIPPLIIIIGQLCLAISSIISVINIIKGIDFAAKIANITSKLSFLTPVINLIKGAFSGLFTLIMAHPVVAIIVAVGLALVSLYKYCTPFKDFVDNLFKKIKDFFKNLNFKTILDKIKNAFASLKTIFSNIKLPDLSSLFGNLGFLKLIDFSSIKTKVSNIFNSITSLVKKFTADFPNMINELINKILFDIGYLIGKIGMSIFLFLTVDIPNYFTSFLTWIVQKGTELKQLFINIWNGIIEFFTVSIPNFLTITLPEYFKNFLLWLVQKGTELKQLFINTWNEIVIFFTVSIPNFFTVTLPNFWNNFWTWLGGIGKNLLQWGKDTWNNILNFFTVEIPKFFTQTLPNWFDSIIQKFENFGKNIIEGLKNGMKNAWETFKNWAKSLFGGIVTGAQDELEIHSPSRKMEREVGVYTVLGMVNPIKDKKYIKDSISIFSKNLQNEVTASTNATIKLKNNAKEEVNNNNIAIYLDSREITNSTLKKITSSLKTQKNNKRFA